MSFDILYPEHPVNLVKKVFLKDPNCYEKTGLLETMFQHKSRQVLIRKGKRNL